MKRHFTTSRHGFTTVGSVIVIGFVGIIVAMMITPSIRALIIRRHIARADGQIQAGNPLNAIQLLQRVQSWSDCYPVLAPQVNRRLVRAYAAAGHIDQALAIAEAMRKSPQPTEVASSTRAPFQLFEVIPNRIFNGINPAPAGRDMGGYDVLRETLTRMNRADLLWGIDQAVNSKPAVFAAPQAPATTNKHIAMSELFPDETPRVKPVSSPPPAPRATTPEVAPPADSTAANEPAPEMDPDRDKALKITRCRAQVKSLEDQLAALKKSAPPVNPQAVAAREALVGRHKAALQKFNEFIAANAKLKTEWDQAQGPRRIDLFEKLKKRKYEEPNYRRELEKIEKDLKAADIASSHDARQVYTRNVHDIEQKLQAVNSELQALEFKR